MKEFIEANRQKGSTTELVWAVIRADGYLVVLNESSKQALIKKFTALRAENVFTLYEIRDGKWRGRETRPVFIDVSCSQQPLEDPIMGLSLKELVRRAKLSASPVTTKEDDSKE